MTERLSVATQHATPADGTSIAYKVTSNGPTVVKAEVLAPVLTKHVGPTP